MLSYYQFLDELLKRDQSEMFSILTFVVNRFIRDKELDFVHMCKFVTEMDRIFNKTIGTRMNSIAGKRSSGAGRLKPPYGFFLTRSRLFRVARRSARRTSYNPRVG